MAPARKDKAHIAYSAPLIEFFKKRINVGRISEISSAIVSAISLEIISEIFLEIISEIVPEITPETISET